MRTERGRALRALSLRPPLWCGGHCFVLLDLPGLPMQMCAGCYATVPRWLVAEGLWAPVIGRWCPSLFKQLTRGTPNEQQATT